MSSRSLSNFLQLSNKYAKISLILLWTADWNRNHSSPAWTGWRHGLTGISLSSTGPNARSCILDGTTPCTTAGWGPTVWAAALHKKMQGSGGHKLNMSQHCDLVVKQASHIPGCLSKYRLGEWCLLYSATWDCIAALYPVLGCPVQGHGWPWSKSSEDHQAGQGMEHWIYEKRLRQLALLSPRNRWLRGEFIAVCHYLIRRQRQDGVKLFSEVHSDRMRDNRNKLQHGKFWVDIRGKNFHEGS